MSTASTPEPVDDAARPSKGRGRNRAQRDKHSGQRASAQDAAAATVYNGWMFARDVVSSSSKTVRLALLLTLVLAILIASIVLVVISGGDVGAMIRGLASGVVGAVGVLLARRWRHRRRTTKVEPPIVPSVLRLHAASV
jgi:hypothetical protein